jgi:hypothetical protein
MLNHTVNKVSSLRDESTLKQAVMQSVIVNAMTTVRKFSDNIIVFGQTLYICCSIDEAFLPFRPIWIICCRLREGKKTRADTLGEETYSSDLTGLKRPLPVSMVFGVSS